MALASSSPLVYRTAVVATGVLCPAAQGRPAAVAAVMQLLSGCIHRPAATMRAWGRGEDHVAAVTFWRLAVSCPAELAPSALRTAARAILSVGLKMGPHTSRAKLFDALRIQSPFDLQADS